MSTPTLSLVVFEDCEKRPELADRFFWSLSRINHFDPETVEFHVITQREGPSRAALAAAKYGILVAVHEAGHERVNGYPVWDVRASLAAIRPALFGRYLTVSHMEFFLCPARLARTVAWLETKRPYVAMGNLRRLGSVAKRREWRGLRTDPELSAAIEAAVVADNEVGVRVLCAEVPSVNWAYWDREPEPGEAMWEEDVPLLDLAFLDACRFWEHGGELPFQDVFDLVGTFFQVLWDNDLAIPAWRMPREVHEALHLWHPKGWDGLDTAMRDWFLARPERWRGTAFLDRDRWAALDGPDRGKAVWQFRNGPGGTRRRFADAMTAWLKADGAAEVRDFYARNGRRRREVA